MLGMWAFEEGRARQAIAGHSRDGKWTKRRALIIYSLCARHRGLIAIGL